MKTKLDQLKNPSISKNQKMRTKQNQYQNGSKNETPNRQKHGPTQNLDLDHIQLPYSNSQIPYPISQIPNPKPQFPYPIPQTPNPKPQHPTLNSQLPTPNAAPGLATVENLYICLWNLLWNVLWIFLVFFCIARRTIIKSQLYTNIIKQYKKESDSKRHQTSSNAVMHTNVIIQYKKESDSKRHQTSPNIIKYDQTSQKSKTSPNSIKHHQHRSHQTSYIIIRHRTSNITNNKHQTMPKIITLKKAPNIIKHHHTSAHIFKHPKHQTSSSIIMHHQTSAPTVDNSYGYHSYQFYSYGLFIGVIVLATVENPYALFIWIKSIWIFHSSGWFIWIIHMDRIQKWLVIHMAPLVWSTSELYIWIHPYELFIWIW